MSVNLYRTWKEAVRGEYKRYCEEMGLPCNEPDLSVLTDREIEIFKNRYVFGNTLEVTGARFGITKARVRMIIINSFTRMSKPNEYPYNFIYRVLKKRLCDIGNIEMDKIQDMIPTLEYVLAATATETELMYIHRRFRDGEPCRNRLNLSRLINEIRDNPQYMKMLKYGIARYIEIQTEEGMGLAFKKEVEKRAEEIVLERTESRPVQIGSGKEADSAPLESASNKFPKTFSTPISELNLSTRTENALRHVRLLTVADILALDGKEDLMKIERFGKTNYSDLMEKLQKLGFDVSKFQE